jgi:hypothetical protein
MRDARIIVLVLSEFINTRFALSRLYTRNWDSHIAFPEKLNS